MEGPTNPIEGNPRIVRPQPCGLTRVALDPLPNMTAESLASLLVDVGRYPFVERTPLRLAAS